MARRKRSDDDDRALLLLSCAHFMAERPQGRRLLRALGKLANERPEMFDHMAEREWGWIEQAEAVLDGCFTPHGLEHLAPKEATIVRLIRPDGSDAA